MGFVVIHPATPEYNPAPAQVEALLDLLRREGILGKPAPHIGTLAWDHGPGFDRLNITATSFPATISIAVSESLPAPDDGEATEEWVRLLDQQYITITVHDAEPLHEQEMTGPIWTQMADALGCKLSALYWQL